jgi:hypothetical protein
MIIHSAVTELLYSYEKTGRRSDILRGDGQNSFNIRILRIQIHLQATKCAIIFMLYASYLILGTMARPWRYTKTGSRTNIGTVSGCQG